MEASEKLSIASSRVPRRILFTFCRCNTFLGLSSHNKLHNVNIILVDAFPGVIDAFQMPPLINFTMNNMVLVKAFGKLLNFLISEV